MNQPNYQLWIFVWKARRIWNEKEAIMCPAPGLICADNVEAMSATCWTVIPNMAHVWIQTLHHKHRLKLKLTKILIIIKHTYPTDFQQSIANHSKPIDISYQKSLLSDMIASLWRDGLGLWTGTLERNCCVTGLKRSIAQKRFEADSWYLLISPDISWHSHPSSIWLTDRSPSQAHLGTHSWNQLAMEALQEADESPSPNDATSMAKLLSLTGGHQPSNWSFHVGTTHLHRFHLIFISCSSHFPWWLDVLTQQSSRPNLSSQHGLAMKSSPCPNPPQWKGHRDTICAWSKGKTKNRKSASHLFVADPNLFPSPPCHQSSDKTLHQNKLKARCWPTGSAGHKCASGAIKISIPNLKHHISIRKT